MLQIILLLLSVFVVYKLYTVLGTHDGDKPQKKASSPLRSPPIASSSSVQPIFRVDSRASQGEFVPALEGFHKDHFYAGALEAYRLIVTGLFTGDLIPCRSFLAAPVYGALAESVREAILEKQEVSVFRLLSLQQEENTLEVQVEAKSSVSFRENATSLSQNILLSHRFTFSRPVDSAATAWVLEAIEAA